MDKLSKRLAFAVPVLAMAMGGSAGASNSGQRALALSVTEGEGTVAIELIANSAITQQVEYEVELIGNSTSRHAGNTSIAGGNRHVLSRLSTNFDSSWCARVNVTEASGERYTLTAGDCA